MASRDYQPAIATHAAAILREEREKRSLSMNALAERAGPSQQLVSYVERDMRNPSLDTLLRICGALKLPVSHVLQLAEQRVKRN